MERCRVHWPRRSRATSTIVSLLLTGVFFTASPVAAQGVGSTGKQRILLLPMQRGEQVSTVIPRRVFEYFKTIMEMNSALEVFVPESLELPEPEEKSLPKSDDPLIEKASQALWEGKDLAGEAKYADAIGQFRRSADLFERRIKNLVDFDQYVDALVNVSICYFLLGETERGEEALAPVVVFRPNILLDKRKAPKKAVESLERLKTFYSGSGGSRVVVKSNVEGAEVFVDGVRQGQAPVEVKGLLHGQHWVQVIKDGYRPWAKAFKLSGRGPTLRANLKMIKAPAGKRDEVAKANPDALIKGAQRGRYGRRFLRAARSIARTYALDAIVATYVRKRDREYDLAAFLYDTEKDKVAELEWVVLDRQLATMQVSLLELEERVLQGTATFPSRRVVRGKSDIYTMILPPPEPEPTPPPPVVVVAPAPGPEAAPEPVAASAPEAADEPMAAPAPETTPEPVAAVEPEAAPEPVAAPAPKLAPEPAPEPEAAPVPAPVAPVAVVPAPVSAPVADSPPPAPAPRRMNRYQARRAKRMARQWQPPQGTAGSPDVAAPVAVSAPAPLPAPVVALEPVPQTWSALPKTPSAPRLPYGNTHPWVLDADAPHALGNYGRVVGVAQTTNTQGRVYAMRMGSRSQRTAPSTPTGALRPAAGAQSSTPLVPPAQVSPSPIPVVAPAPAPRTRKVREHRLDPPSPVVAVPAAPVAEANPLLRTPPMSSVGADRVDAETWYEKWWVWTLVGVGVVGGATAAGVVLGGADSESDGFRATVRWSR
jgi:hypothetical protein